MSATPPAKTPGTKPTPTPLARPSAPPSRDTPAEEVTRPVPVPAGTYNAVVRGLYEEGVSSQKKTPFVKFTYALLSAGDDVDEAELAAIGGLEGKTIRDTYYTTPDALFRLTDTLINMGIDTEDKTIRQCLAETPN